MNDDQAKYGGSIERTQNSSPMGGDLMDPAAALPPRSLASHLPVFGACNIPWQQRFHRFRSSGLPLVAQPAHSGRKLSTALRSTARDHLYSTYYSLLTRTFFADHFVSKHELAALHFTTVPDQLYTKIQKSDLRYCHRLHLSKHVPFHLSSYELNLL